MRDNKPLPRPRRKPAATARSRPLVEQTINIHDEYITLGQLLKMTGVIGTGGEAKYYLAETVVQVNGEPEQRRGRKLRPGDVIVAPGHPPVRILGAAPEDEPERLETATETSREASLAAPFPSIARPNSGSEINDQESSH